MVSVDTSVECVDGVESVSRVCRECVESVSRVCRECQARAQNVNNKRTPLLLKNKKQNVNPKGAALGRPAQGPRAGGERRSHGWQHAERCAAPQAAPEGNAQGNRTAESSPGRKAPQRPGRPAEAPGARATNPATASEEGAPTTPTEAWSSTTSTAQQRSARPEAAESATEH